MNRIILVVISLFLINQSYSYPFIPTAKSYVKAEYNAGRQNWDVDFDSYGTVYFANNKGLLHYTHENWELYETSTKDNLRSLYVLNDTIWVGGNIELGYFYTGNDNTLQYKNVADINRGQVWRIEHNNGLIYAQTEAGIFIHDISKSTTRMINEGVGCFNICKFNNDIWEIDRNFSIGKIINGEIVVVSQLPEKNSDVVDFFVHKNRLMIALQNGNLYSYDKNGQFELLQLPDDLVKASVFKVGSYDEDVLMIATITDGIVLYDILKEEIITTINAKNGLADNTVLSMKKDKNGNLWAGLDYGIGYVENQRVLKTIFKSAASYDFEIYGDSSLIATNKGLFYSASNSEFKLHDDIHGHAWQIKKHQKGYFICHNYGIYDYDFSGNVQQVYKTTGVLDLVNFKGTNKFIVSAYTGLLYMEYKNGEFKELGNLYYWGNPKIAYDSENSAIWAKSGDGELKKFTLINDEKNVDTETFNGPVDFFNVNDKILFYTGDSLQVIKNNNFVGVDYFPFSQVKGENITKLASSIDENKISYIKNGRIEYLFYLSDGNSYSFGNVLRSLESKLIKHAELISFYGEDLWIGTDRGIERFQPNTNIKYKRDLRPFVARIIVNGQDFSKTYYYPYLLHDLFLENSPLDLTIDFGINKGSSDIVEFRHKLTPYENRWSEWSHEKQKGFSKLPGGDYTLQIESRVNNGNVYSNELSISVEKRWFETSVIYLVILIVLAIVILMFMLIYQYLSNRKIERLKEIQRLENYQETIKNKNEQLYKYTEVLNNKNMFLRGIKVDLSLVKHKLAERSIRKIDQELNSNDQDLIFHNLFTDIHQDFIQRLNDKYPALTAHDIRFLSLIRLNQSNDQIANMMNISPKSVNVTRYRIRKKMDLEHEVDLNKFIIDF